MKNLNISRKLIITVVFIIIASIIFAVMIFTNKSKAAPQETVAKAVLTKTYGVSLQDYEKLTNALTQSLSDSKILLDYLHTVYGEQLTENGYKIFMNNRIPSIAANTAHEENSDLKVSSIELEPEDAVEGSVRYAFTIQVQTKKDASKIITFKGSITLIQENGSWKVDGGSPG
ncbi:MAG: hypothetical protein WCD89_20820 [Anaerocolumna sp.]